MGTVSWIERYDPGKSPHEPRRELPVRHRCRMAVAGDKQVLAREGGRIERTIDHGQTGRAQLLDNLGIGVSPRCE
jgi:hypothetical protein